MTDTLLFIVCDTNTCNQQLELDDPSMNTNVLCPSNISEVF